MTLWCPNTILPELTDATQAVFRAAYGVLLFGTLVLALRHGRRFFLGERWGGYAKSSPAVDLLHNPIALPLVFTIWLTASVLLTFGVFTVVAAVVNLALC